MGIIQEHRFPFLLQRTPWGTRPGISILADHALYRQLEIANNADSVCCDHSPLCPCIVLGLITTSAKTISSGVSLRDVMALDRRRAARTRAKSSLILNGFTM